VSGATTADELRVAIWTQRLKNGHWRDLPGSIGFDSKQFNANGSKHSIVAARSGQVTQGQTWRIVVDFSAYDVGTLLYDDKGQSASCSGG